MIEISYLEFIRNTVKYTNAVIEREEQIVVMRGSRSFFLIADHTVSLIKIALDVAATTIDDPPEAFTVIDSA